MIVGAIVLVVVVIIITATMIFLPCRSTPKMMDSREISLVKVAVLMFLVTAFLITFMFCPSFIVMLLLVFVVVALLGYIY